MLRAQAVELKGLVALQGAGAITPERLAALAEAGARTSRLLERLAMRWISLWLAEEEAGVCHVPMSAFRGLPPALQEANPLNLRRMIDGKIS